MNAGDLLEANCRIAGAWPIPSPQAHDELISTVELLELPTELRDLIKGFGWSEDEIEELLDGDRVAWEALFDQMINSGKSGWLVQADTPVYQSDGRNMFYSWGYHHHTLIFATDIGEGLQKAVDWAEARYEDAKAKHAAAKEVA